MSVERICEVCGAIEMMRMNFGRSEEGRQREREFHSENRCLYKHGSVWKEHCEGQRDERMKHIGQNGNDGLHYFNTDCDYTAATDYAKDITIQLKEKYGPCSSHAFYDEEHE